ncbi:putative iron-regulated membrane protein [Variovorax boronicumulans]|uniref:Iron-regulated membrane protein n=1 Tax=Variovorax boronicumulans TaxID=436515 RepID=A0AAW8CY32_9BURK|nr:putative iron-regulated membrane protein [Variovorax boronicumulans]MDQ0056382.1 putative iron-regulated membrane protein [Variovorax boronicumulans]
MGAASGDTIKTWLTNLHMASMWGRPMKLFLCVLCLAVTVLCVTGVVIWGAQAQGSSQCNVLACHLHTRSTVDARTACEIQLSRGSGRVYNKDYVK